MYDVVIGEDARRVELVQLEARRLSVLRSEMWQILATGSSRQHLAKI